MFSNIKTAQQNYLGKIEDNKNDYKAILTLPIAYYLGNKTHPYQIQPPYQR